MSNSETPWYYHFHATLLAILSSPWVRLIRFVFRVVPSHPIHDMHYGSIHALQSTKVFLNVYDLSPANEYLVPFLGLGLHHSGVEISGREYSYGSGGGIFEGPPRTAPGARFRCQVELGTIDAGIGSKELNRALDELRHHRGFGPNGYNLVRRNCNHFCNALSWQLLRRPIPAYVNRLANLGECCSCLLPKQLLDDSPVGGSGDGSGNSNRPSPSVPTNTSMNRGGNSNANVFAGKGHSLGGTSSTRSVGTSPSSESAGLLSRWSSSTSKGSSGGSGIAVDDLTDRREKARIAALARLERSQQQQQQQQASPQQQQP
jgi:deubiquitinase DESI2